MTIIMINDFQGNSLSSDQDGESLRIKIGAYNFQDGKSKRHRRKQNRVVSTKYSPLTFLPQNLFEVLSNFNFLLFKF